MNDITTTVRRWMDAAQSIVPRSANEPSGPGWTRATLRRPAMMPGMTLAALASLVALSAETTVYVNKFFEVREHDQPVKYVFNGDTRVARVTGSLSANTRVQRLRLEPGWNLRSLAVTATNAFRQITNAPALRLDSQSVFRWNPPTRSWLSLVPDETLPAGTVLWLHAATHTTVALTGAYTDPANRAVEAGGSFQPGSGLEALPLPGLEPDVPIWTFDSSSQQWQRHLPVISFSDPDFPGVLAPGEAVFVNAEAPEELEVPETALRIRYYHPDHLGSSSVMTDAEGALVEETAFYPFGHPRHEHQPRQIEDPYKFTEKEQDRESGLHYFGGRYLVGRLGRFASVDPRYANPDQLDAGRAGAAQGPGFFEHSQLQNLYAFAAGNPLKFIDPDGKEVTWSKALENDKTFQKALRIVQGTKEGARILASLESARVSVDVGKLPGNHGSHAVGDHHGSAEFTKRTRTATSVITIDLAKSKRLKQTAEDLANVIHHELRHAEIHNTVGPSEDYSTDAGIARAEAVRNSAHKKLDVYLPYSYSGGKGTGVQTSDPRNADFQKEIGLLPPDYSVSGAGSGTPDSTKQ